MLHRDDYNFDHDTSGCDRCDCIFSHLEYGLERVDKGAREEG